ncbi:MAG: YebC/PmpR family DNA-binding transcriptional regulator [Elusimicrobia bacterium]|nr:YebC/PmpR family DNA-binding transcriptional regulator [Elusimicrobiota bacterium]
MGGHSHWAGIKHKKAVIDAKRSKVFTRIIREITIAARIGGGILDNNPRLRKAIDDARAANMPADNVKRAIMKGTGELPGVQYEELTYEGYGPGGVAITCEVTTDSRNRTTSEIRRIFEKFGGNLGETGCVSWMFDQKGMIVIKKDQISEDKLTELVLEAGAEDLNAEDDEFYTIYTSPKDLDAVKKHLAGRELALESCELTMVPKSFVDVSGKDAEKVVALMEALEEHDDTKNSYANFDIPK